MEPLNISEIEQFEEKLSSRRDLHRGWMRRTVLGGVSFQEIIVVGPPIRDAEPCAGQLVPG